MQMWSILCYMIWWSPGGVIDSFVREDASSYHKLVKRAQVSKSFTILLHEAWSSSAHDFIVASVVGSNLNNEIAHKYRHVVLPGFIKLKERIFLFIINVIGGMMFRLILQFVVLNFAVINLELTGSHPKRALCDSRDSISPTPSVWGLPP